MRKSNLHLLSRLRFLSARRRFEWYPPFWLMRVRVEELADDWSRARIRLPLSWVSANAAGNMFGGYQACLADPVPAIACVYSFPGYRVATKSLAMDFLHVGNSDLLLHFDFDAKQRGCIRRELEQHGRANPSFDMICYREDRKICTEIRNTVAIRSLAHDGKTALDGRKWVMLGLTRWPALSTLRGLYGMPSIMLALSDLMARSSVGEHHLDTVGVGSSILPAPTISGCVLWLPALGFSFPG